MEYKFITDYEGFFNKAVDSITDYVLGNNLQSVHLGISGGIDSTVVACILSEVSKKVNKHNEDEWNEDIKKNSPKEDSFWEMASDPRKFIFYGWSLPSKATNEKELLSSEIVGKTFADYFKINDISEVSQEISDFCETCKLSDKYRNGNIKARMRMIFLYDKAKLYNGIVVGTDNYTEKLLGFSTIGGDDLADFMPIQNLWKTEVFGLAEWLVKHYTENGEKDKAAAIMYSLSLKPQDGLGISTDDMEQIGAKDYYQVDEILIALMKVKENPEYTVSDFFNIIESDDPKKDTYRAVEMVSKRYLKNFKLDLPLTVEVNRI